jgi:hypothetical protein
MQAGRHARWWGGGGVGSASQLLCTLRAGTLVSPPHTCCPCIGTVGDCWFKRERCGLRSQHLNCPNSSYVIPPPPPAPHASPPAYAGRSIWHASSPGSVRSRASCSRSGSPVLKPCMGERWPHRWTHRCVSGGQCWQKQRRQRVLALRAPIQQRYRHRNTEIQIHDDVCAHPPAHRCTRTPT